MPIDTPQLNTRALQDAAPRQAIQAPALRLVQSERANLTEKLPDERLPSKYFKKMSPTPMNRFLAQYGDSPRAMRAMEDHILDTYRREVVRGGALDPKRHETFIRNYAPALKQLPEMWQNLDSMGKAAGLLAERESQLIEAQSSR